MLGLPTADKPAVACLSSRFSYGDKITVEKLSQVAQAESAIKRLGFVGFRLRHHDKLARLEFRIQDLNHAWSQRMEIAAAVKDAGYRFVTIDLEGFRSGKMNDDLPETLFQIRTRESRQSRSPHDEQLRFS